MFEKSTKYIVHSVRSKSTIVYFFQNFHESLHSKDIATKVCLFFFVVVEKTRASHIRQCFDKICQKREFFTLTFSKIWQKKFKEKPRQFFVTRTLKITFKVVVTNVWQKRGLAANERGVTVLKIYLSEIKFEISKNSYCKDAGLPIINLPLVPFYQ